MAQAPAQNFVTPVEDSRRWRNVARRPGDIIISTPPKSGTTWTQGIVASLLWPDGELPGRRGQLSPWVDARVTLIGELVERLDAQTHRRFLKTHSPGDCIPFDQRCQYIVVYRDGRDSLVSWGNHRSKMRTSVVDAINEAGARDGVRPLAREWNGDYDVLFEEWLDFCSPLRHLASWWPRRHETNVLFVHYDDLTAELGAEMARIAEFLDIDVESGLWPQVVDRCRLDDMRSEAEAAGGWDGAFEGGAAAFFYKGGSGRWRNLLTDAQVERYHALVAEQLPSDAAAWLERGSLELGVRPDEIGTADTTTLDTGRWHPVFSRLRRRPSNSIDAITDRRVDEAREAGLFDDLSMHGRPLADLDRSRQPGWWANRFVAKERNKVQALQLELDLGKQMPALWRLATENEVVAKVADLNADIDRYNQRTTLAPMERLDVSETLTTWRALKQRNR